MSIRDSLSFPQLVRFSQDNQLEDPIAFSIEKRGGEERDRGKGRERREGGTKGREKR